MNIAFYAALRRPHLPFFGGTVKVIIALPLPVPFAAELEKHLTDKKTHFRGWISVQGKDKKHFEQISAREEYRKRFEWIPKAYRRIAVAIFDNVDAAAAGLLEMAVKQAAVGSSQIHISSNRLSTQPEEDPRLGYRHIVGLDIDKGKTEIIRLAEMIDKALMQISIETSHVLSNRIKRPFTPYLAIIRQGRTTRALATNFARETVFEPPLECVLNRIIVNISNGKDYRVQKLIWLK
jgi:hypothetical protein